MNIPTPQSTVNPSDFLPPFLSMTSVNLPVLTLTKQRNTQIDQLFYDVGALSKKERDFLAQETNLEGSILVVYPQGSRGDLSIVKYADYPTLRAAPGQLLRHFSIAGVGSSDFGAAAFARNLADHVQKPVGAIVAGYGMTDLLAEGMGGWFFLEAKKQLLQYLHQWRAVGKTLLEPLVDTQATHAIETTASVAALAGSPDSDTLFRLLQDEEREIQILLGHSKGCLSIATALEALAVAGSPAALQKAKAIRVITTGAVVELPDGFDKAIQFLGEWDGFGVMNSRLHTKYETVAGAWHHVNPAIPLHMSIHDVLVRADELGSALH
ncbi:MAG: hypothetical protein QG599_1178 [Pseudomonadota bacterium]|nr:hypothetical protein [Pseudomonadota bacterium]